MILLNSPSKTLKFSKINLLSILDRKENKLGSQYRNLSNHIYYINLNNNHLLLMHDTTENTSILASYDVEYDETDTTFYLKFTNDGGSSYSDVPTAYGDGSITSLDDIYSVIFSRVDNDPKLSDTATELTTGKVAVVNAEGLLKKSDKTYDNINNVLDLTEYSDASNKIAVVNSGNTLKRSDRTYGDIVTISDEQTITGRKTFFGARINFTTQHLFLLDPWITGSNHALLILGSDGRVCKSDTYVGNLIQLDTTQTITGQKTLSNLRLDNPVEDTTLTNSIITIDSNNQIQKSNLPISTVTNYSEWKKISTNGDYLSVFMNSPDHRVETISKSNGGRAGRLEFNGSYALHGSSPPTNSIYFEYRGSTYIVLTSDSKIYRYADSAWPDISDGLNWMSVSVGTDEKIFGVASDYYLYKRNDSDDGWDKLKGAIDQISVANVDYVYAHNSGGSIYYYRISNNSWYGISRTGIGNEAVTHISVGDDGIYYTVSNKNKLYKHTSGGWSYERDNVKQVSYNPPYIAILNLSDDVEVKCLNENLYLNNPTEDTTLANHILTIDSSNQIKKSNLKNLDIYLRWEKLNNITCNSVFMTTVVDQFRFDCVFTDGTIGYVDVNGNITPHTTDAGDTFTYIEKRTVDKDYIIGVTTDYRILYHYDNVWHNISHGIAFKAVSMGSDGAIWGLGTNRSAYQYTGSGWSGKGGLNDYISVADAGNVCVCNGVRPYVWKGYWASIGYSPTNSRNVAIDENGVIYMRHRDTHLYRLENGKTTYLMSGVYSMSYNDYCLAVRYSDNTVEYYPMLPPSLVKKLKQLSVT